MRVATNEPIREKMRAATSEGTGSSTVNFPKLEGRSLGAATNSVPLPKPKPRAMREHLVMLSIGSSDVACCQWPNVRRLEHFL
jgi:hypothetical protein